MKKISHLSSLTSHLQAGFSVIEVILAAALFIIFTSGTIGVVIQGMSINRLAAEQATATQYAAEGLEAARSIKNQAYTNLSAVNPTPRGISRSGNVWVFDGDSTNDTLVHNSSDNYIRTIKVEPVNRHVPPPSGDIQAIGTNDPDTKKVTSSVAWNFSNARPQSVDLVTYLSDWKKIIPSGILVYGDGTTTPKYRTYDNGTNTFGLESNAPIGAPPAAGVSYMLRTSPQGIQAVAGYVTTGGILHVMCYSGSVWSEDWTANVGGNGSTKRFDIAYETATGDVVVLYSTNTATNNELAYRTKAGGATCGSTNWVGPTTISAARTNGVVQWVKMAADRRTSSSSVTAIWADAANDLSALIWNGTGWVNEPVAVTDASLETITAGQQNVDDFDVEYESLSGDVIIVWANSAGANGVNGVRYRTCTAPCTVAANWGPVTTPATFVDDAHNLDISANPDTNEILFASIGDSGDDLQVGYWTGSAWNNTGGANKDITSQSPIPGSRNVATGWVISGALTRGIVVYHDAVTDGRISYVALTPGASPTWTATLTSNPAPSLNSGNTTTFQQQWYEIEIGLVNKDRLILTSSNALLDLFAKRLVLTAGPTFTWTDANGGSVLETALGQAIASPYSFKYWRNP